jgi:hypothetical protein
MTKTRELNWRGVAEVQVKDDPKRHLGMIGKEWVAAGLSARTSVSGRA